MTYHTTWKVSLFEVVKLPLKDSQPLASLLQVEFHCTLHPQLQPPVVRLALSTASTGHLEGLPNKSEPAILTRPSTYRECLQPAAIYNAETSLRLRHNSRGQKFSSHQIYLQLQTNRSSTT